MIVKAMRMGAVSVETYIYDLCRVATTRHGLVKSLCVMTDIDG